MNLFRSRPIVDLTPEELAPESLVELQRDKLNSAIAKLEFDRESRKEEIERLQEEVAEIDLTHRALSAALEVFATAGTPPALGVRAGAPRLSLAGGRAPDPQRNSGGHDVRQPTKGTPGTRSGSPAGIDTSPPQGDSV